VEGLLIANILQQEDSSTMHFSVSSPVAVDHSDHVSGSVSLLGDDHQGQHSPTGSYSAHSRGRNYNHLNPNLNYSQELSVRFGPGWKGVLSNARVDCASSDEISSNSPSRTTSSSQKNKSTAKDEAQEILYSLRRDMIQLWHDPAVRDILRKRKIRLEESSGL
jgi:guanine nucleotide-binding protein subunit alpha